MTEESNSFRHGAVEYGQVIKNNIPFIIWKFHGFDLDCFINFWKEPQEVQEAFLAGPPESNLLQIYLVDRETKVTQGIRAIGARLEFMTSIKSACFDQLSAYSNAHDVDVAAMAVLNQISIEDLGRAAGINF